MKSQPNYGEFERFNKLRDPNNILRPCVNELRDLYERLGCPQEPNGQIMFYNGPRLLDSSDLDDDEFVGDSENKHNELVIELFRLIGVDSMSGDVWFTQHVCGADAWEHYQKLGRILIDEYAKWELWKSLRDDR